MKSHKYFWERKLLLNSDETMDKVAVRVSGTKNKQQKDAIFCLSSFIGVKHET